MSNDTKPLSTSNDRHSFGRERYKKILETNPDDEHAKLMIDFLQDVLAKEKTAETQPEFRQDNLEYDMRSTGWFSDKVKNSKAYAQNVYAALCNNDFQKLEVLPILKDQTWSCSWRYAGGIVAHLRGEGDYIDWYCSGIRDTGQPEKEEWESWSEQQKEHYLRFLQYYVPESIVTDEVREDLKRLGWTVLDQDD